MRYSVMQCGKQVADLNIQYHCIRYIFGFVAMYSIVSHCVLLRCNVLQYDAERNASGGA